MSYDKVTQILSEYNGVMLDFSYVKVSKLPRMPRNLKMLICSFSSIESLPSLPDGLVELNCIGCTKLKRVPYLPHSLKYLAVCFTDIKWLPRMPNGLESLWFTETKIREVPVFTESVNDFRCDDCVHINAEMKESNLYFLRSLLPGLRKYTIKEYFEKKEFTDLIDSEQRIKMRNGLIQHELMTRVFQKMEI
jgi:hypothetical protein